MPDDWQRLLADVPTPDPDTIWWIVLLRLVVATLFGAVVALIHHYTTPRSENGTRGFVATLILLSLLLAMVVIAVGGSPARAFSLAGIMAIVRFRTVVENTRDSVFVICSVVVGMATGAGYYSVALMGLPLVAVIAYLTHLGAPGRNGTPSVLKIRTGLTGDQQPRVEEALRRYADAWTVLGSSTARQGAALDVAYHVRLKPQTQAVDMVKDLNRIEGVQEVEWKSNS